MFLFLDFFRVSDTCTGCFELFVYEFHLPYVLVVSENLPEASRFFGTYKNSVLIFNHN